MDLLHIQCLECHNFNLFHCTPNNNHEPHSIIQEDIYQVLREDQSFLFEKNMKNGEKKRKSKNMSSSLLFHLQVVLKVVQQNNGCVSMEQYMLPPPLHTTTAPFSLMIPQRQQLYNVRQLTKLHLFLNTWSSIPIWCIRTVYRQLTSWIKYVSLLTVTK